MDPVSQGVLGAAAVQSATSGKQIGVIALLGFVSGMAADLDVLIRSASDPLLFLEFHRHFTHSLIFIPVGGSLCALVLYWLYARKRQLDFLTTWLYCTLGYATHALLDACTTYGTMLFWPFSDARISWNNLSVVDPLFTIPVALLVIFSIVRKNPLAARIALCWVFLYGTMGWIQKERAEAAGHELARERGHVPIQLGAKPSFGNMILWKIVYEYEGRYFVDAIRIGFEKKVIPGSSVRKLDTSADLPWLDLNSQQARDLERFRWFSMGYLAVDQKQSDLIIDVRYSMLPNEINALWGIRFDPNAASDQHIQYVTQRDGAEARAKLLMEMIFN